MFEVDTGVTEFDPRSRLPDWFVDMFPEDTPVEKLLHDYGYAMIAAMQKPAKIETVRKHLLADWPVLRIIGDMKPAVLDEILESYAERLNRP